MFSRIPEFYSEFNHEMSNKCHAQSSAHNKNHNKNSMIQYWILMTLRSGKYVTYFGVSDLNCIVFLPLLFRINFFFKMI